MKILNFLYRAGTGGMMGAGIAFITILLIVSLAKLQGTMLDAKINVNTITTNGYLYLWAGIFLAYVIGGIAVVINKGVQQYRDKRNKGN